MFCIEVFTNFLFLSEDNSSILREFASFDDGTLLTFSAAPVPIIVSTITSTAGAITDFASYALIFVSNQ